MELIRFYIALTGLNILIVFFTSNIRKRHISELNSTTEQLKSETKKLNKRVHEDAIKYCMIIEQQITVINVLKQFVWSLNTEEYAVIPEMIEYATKCCQNDNVFDSKKRETYKKVFENISTK